MKKEKKKKRQRIKQKHGYVFLKYIYIHIFFLEQSNMLYFRIVLHVSVDMSMNKIVMSSLARYHVTSDSAEVRI